MGGFLTFYKRSTFVTSCLLSCNQAPEKRSTITAKFSPKNVRGWVGGCGGGGGGGGEANSFFLIIIIVIPNIIFENW